MSRLPERLRAFLKEAGMLLLVSWALLKPALQILMLSRESGFAFALTAALSLLVAAVPQLQKRLRVFIVLGLLAGAVVWALWGPLFPALYSVTDALLSGRGATPALLLYSDILLPAMALPLVLYARLLVHGEPGFSAPLLLTTVLMMWFSGARQSIADFIPAVAAVPLMFTYAPAPEEAPLQRPSQGASRGMLRMLPVVLAITLLAVALTPPYRTTDPALEQQADKLRQAINDNFFFTDSRESFSLSAAGYQPMGDRGLGGKPQISNALVMEVDTDRKLYLRGTVLDLYNGRMWYDSISRERYGYASLRYQQLRDSLLDADLPVPSLRVPGQEAAVRLLGPLPSTLFVPQRLRQLTVGEGMVPYLNASSELFITRNLKEGDAYTFRYEPYVGGEEATRRLAEQLSAVQPQMQAGQAIYRQIPAHLQPDGVVAGLTHDIVGMETDPYRVAMLLRNYLREHYAYSLDVPDAPEDMDFVAHFLFEGKKGYCTYFASAMTVMARIAGLEARYVEGFAVSPSADGGPTLVTGQMAHAWTEVLIPGLGWVPFDATATTGNMPPSPDPQPEPPSGDPTPEPSDQPPPPGEQEQPTPEPAEAEPSPSPSPQPQEQPTQEPQPTPEDRPDEQRPRGAWWLWLLLALLVAFVVWRVRESDPHRRAHKGSPRDRVLLYWHAMIMAHQLAGRGAQPSETLRDWAVRVAPQDRGLQSLADSVSALIYGRHLADADRVMTARLYYQSAWQALSRPNRVRLLAWRVAEDILTLFLSGWRSLKDRVDPRKKLRNKR